MGNNSRKYLKNFLNRNLINESLRKKKTKETNNFTTITDLLLLPLLPMITFFHFLEKVFNKKASK